MDGPQFDALTRSLAAPKTRRGFLGSLAALGVGLLGARAADAQQVTQAQCGNRICASNPGVCTNGCVCCVYPNGNSRCRPPGTCSPGTAATTTTTAPTTTTTTVAPTTTTTQPPCVPESDAAACLRTGADCGPTTNNCGQVVASCGSCGPGQTCCDGTCSGCPCGQVQLCNGSCATPCEGVTCAGCFACFIDVSNEAYCQSPGIFGECESDCDCELGQFCGTGVQRCLPLCQPA